MKKMWRKFRKWADGFLLAGQGILLAFREKSFLIAFFVSFLVFGTLMNLLSGGLGIFSLIAASGFFGGVKIIFGATLGLFGIERTFVDWAAVFFVALLQGILIGLVVFVYKKKKKMNSESLQNAGIAAGLAMLGTGCPTCGTALLTPVIGAIFSGSSALVGTISGAITAIAILIAILSLRKIGEETYVIIKSEEYKTKKKVEES